jgi:hypothetical protein
MAVTVNDELRDGGLDWGVANGLQIDLCSTDPGLTYATVSANSLGSAAVTCTLGNHTPDGRKLTIPAISGATTTADGTATHWALSDGSLDVVASGTLSASEAITNNNEFDLTTFTIAIRDAVDNWIVNLDGQVISNTTPSTPYARLRIDDNGNMYRSIDQGTPSWTQIDSAADWITPETEAMEGADSPWWVRWNYSSGVTNPPDSVTNSTASGTWYRLNAGDFELYNNTTGTLHFTRFTIEIGYGGTTAPAAAAASGTYDLSVEVS